MLLNSEVRLTIIDDEANSTLFATCRDLSATGMAMELSHPLELGTMVRARVESTNSSIQPLDVTGKVVRVEEESAESFIIGIAIEEMD